MSVSGLRSNGRCSEYHLPCHYLIISILIKIIIVIVAIAMMMMMLVMLNITTFL